MIIEKGSLAASVSLLPSLSPHIQERDKFYMSRIVVLELLQALKFKSPLPDTNLLLLVQVKQTTSLSISVYNNQIFIDDKSVFHPDCSTRTFAVVVCQFVCSDIGTRLAESTIIQKHMISTLPGVSYSIRILLESAS